MFWFINRNIKNWLVYNGDISDIDSCMEDTDAIDWWHNKPEYITKFSEMKFNIYGKDYKISLPVIDSINNVSNTPKKQKIEDITDKFKDYIAKNGSMKLLSDTVIGIWQKILLDYECVSVLSKGMQKSWIMFKQRQQTKQQVKTTTESKALTIFKKELMDGYVRNEAYNLKKKWDPKQELNLHEEYNIDGVKIPYNYTAALRKAMFYNATKKMGRDKLMMDWQYDVIKNMGRMTYVVASRRSGKTFLAAFIAMREIMKSAFSMQNQLRPINVIYIGLTKTKNLKVVNYIKNMTKQMGGDVEWMFHWDSTNNIYSFRSAGTTLGEISFVSAESTDPWVGDYADLIIIDESWKIPRSIYEGIEPIVLTEWARLLCVSTLYKDSIKWWFYEKLIDAEKQNKIDIDTFIDDNFMAFANIELETNYGQQEYQKLCNDFAAQYDMVGLRYTIDDIEYINDKQRENMRSQYQKDPDRYMAELYSRFPEDGKVFKYNQVLTIKDKLYLPAYKHIVIGYDPALTQDNSSVILGWYDEARGKICTIQEYDLKKDGKYETQIDQLAKIIKASRMFLQDELKGEIFFAMDWSQKGTAEALQMKWLVVNLRIAWTSGQDITFNPQISNEHRVPKKMLIEIAQNLIDNNKVLISMDLKWLCKEFDYYQRVESKNGGAAYQWVGDKDDKVSAFMIMCYYFYNVLGIKYDLYKPEVKQLWLKTSQEEIYKFNKMKNAEKELIEKQIALRTARAEYWRKNVY